jgi:hypothetical protein
MSRENSTWGAPRIESELRLLGIDVAERTVAKYMVRKRKPPTQTWRTFLNNHLLEVTDINILEACCSTLRQFYRFAIGRRWMADICSATPNGATKPFSGEILISVFGDCCSATECNVKPCRRTEAHHVKPSEPACLLLDINSTRFRERGPPRQDARFTTSDDREMDCIYVRAA